MSTIMIDMKTKLLLITILILTTFIFAQEMKLYAPFPSRIKAETAGKEIILTWKDAKDVIEGSYEIYRAEIALTADNLYLAERIAAVQAGIQTYSDIPPLGVDLYYAVFAKDETQVFKICIPYRNVTTTAVNIDESDIEETISTVISEIKTNVYNTEVTLEFSSSLEDREVILFRSTSPIDSFEKILSSIIIFEDSGSALNYTDTPMAGIDYYYAAVDKELYRSGNENLLYEGNYTQIGRRVKFSHELEDDARYSKASMPLPLLKLTADLESGERLDEQKRPETIGSISNENLRSINRLIEKSALPYDPVESSVLSYNKNINPVISGYFLKKKWEETISRLENYTSLTFDEETRIQSHFYRGQAFFFQGLYNKAMLEFIMVEKVLFIETEPFFKAIYDFQKNM